VSDSDTFSCVGADVKLAEHVRSGAEAEIFGDYDRAYRRACTLVLGQKSESRADTLAFRTCASSADCPADEGCCRLNAVSELAEAPALDICTELVGGQCPTQEVCVDSEPGCRGEGLVCAFDGCVRKDRVVLCNGRICEGGEFCCGLGRPDTLGNPECLPRDQCPTTFEVACSGASGCADGFECRRLKGSRCRRVGSTAGLLPFRTLCESDADCRHTACAQGAPVCEQHFALRACICGPAAVDACKPSMFDGTLCALKGSSDAGHCHKGTCVDERQCRAVCKATAVETRAQCYWPSGCESVENSTLEACLSEVCHLSN
jgi:hypothetical protein